MRRLLYLLIGIITLTLFFYFINPRETWEGIKQIRVSYLIIGYFFFFISHGIKFYRWGLILEKIKKVPFLKIFEYYWASQFINNFMPLRIGEVTKSLFLKKDYDIDISSSMSTVIVDRFYGIIVRLSVVLLIPFLDTELFSYLRNYLIYIICLNAILLFFIIVLLIRYQSFMLIINKLFFFLPRSWNQRLVSFFETSVVAIKKIHLQKKDICIFTALSVLGLLTQALLVYFLFKSVGIVIPISIYIITITIMDFFAMLPSPPASIGTTEWYTNIVYTVGLGISKNTVASITLVSHAINLFIIGILGMICLIAIGQGMFIRGRVDVQTQV